jgi:hypothetical protein
MKHALGLALASAALVACSVSVEQGTVPPSGAPIDSGAGSPSEVSPGATGSLVIDKSLLDVLPRTVDSLPVTEEPDGDDQLRADDVAAMIASAGVAAVAVDQQTDDLALVFVLRLLPNGLTDNTFGDWRDSYDATVCDGADQVVGEAEQNVGTNHIFIGTCSSGLRTYHTWIKARGILISISSTGERRLGLAILGNLPK